MEIKVLLGPICSGKTTYSHYLRDEQGYTRFCMDEMKMMMFGSLNNNEAQDNYVASVICNNILLAMPKISARDLKVVVDGFPLMHQRLKLLVNYCKNVHIVKFNVSLFEANVRNRKRKQETGLWIDPEEIKNYNEAYYRFIESDDFKEIIDKFECVVVDMDETNNMYNPEHLKKKCSYVL